MSKQIDPYQLYSDMLKDFFTSRGYTEEYAEVISLSVQDIQEKLLKLEDVKIIEELKNVIDNLRFLPKKVNRL